MQSYFGANVLHPRTTIPVMKHDIPVTIRNVFNVSAPGTKIGKVSVSEPGEAPVDSNITDFVKGFATVDNLSLINVEGYARMLIFLWSLGSNLSFVDFLSSFLSLRSSQQFDCNQPLTPSAKGGSCTNSSAAYFVTASGPIKVVNQFLKGISLSMLLNTCC